MTRLRYRQSDSTLMVDVLSAIEMVRGFSVMSARL